MSWLITGSQKVNWDPSLITTSLWLDAADETTFSYRSGSTTLISEWRDKSGNSRHCSQSTESLQPTRSTTALNSKPAVTFTDHILNNASASLPLISRSIFLVCYESSAVDYAGFLSVKPSSGNDYDTAGAIAIESGASAINFSISGTASTSYTLTKSGSGATPAGIYTEIKEASLGTLYVNGTSAATDNSFTEFSANSSNGYLLGGRYLAGAISSLYRLNGGIAEIIYAGTTLNAFNRQKVEGYLAHKWALTSSLPSDHPYKVNPPAP